MNTVTFGLSSAPFLALRTIAQLVMDERTKFPLAAEVVERDLYIDDVVTSAPSLDTAQRVVKELVSMFKCGQFQLVKWQTNSNRLTHHIPESIRLSSAIEFKESDEPNRVLKVLGLQWKPDSDAFSFVVIRPDLTCSKRNILSTVSRIWDPLGFLAPVTLYVKLLIKDLWIAKLDWDEPTPLFIRSMWESFCQEISSLISITIPRFLGADERARAILIGFCDGSERGYGAVIYIKIIDGNAKETVNLLCAKSKVSPLKVVSIACLELSAAVLLSKLMTFVQNTIDPRIKIEKIFALSDSTVTLQWINGEPYKWKTFVANRVTKIRDEIPASQWYFVSTDNNAADCVSRGLTPTWLLEHTTWISGPPWLKQPLDLWPISKRFSSPPTSEEVKSIVLTTTRHSEDNAIANLIRRMSSWNKLRRVVVYVLRFLGLLPKGENISAADLDAAETVLIKAVQSQHFDSELIRLRKGQECSKSFRSLNLFLDRGLLRVGGRISNAPIPYEKAHQILLPKHDHLTNLIIDYYHVNNLHTGPHLLLSLVQQKYWIVSARTIIRQRLRLCNHCFRCSPKTQTPLMADLPTPRVTEAKPFLHTGIDYAGTFSVTMSVHRGVRSYKAYICLFVCLATKAIHLELASSLSTACFLSCYKRFISRRGPVQCLYSDNGSNFVGAKTQMDVISDFLRSDEFKNKILSEFSHHKIEWKFSPPSAPHFGGLWEANIKSVKKHLTKVVGQNILSYEELNTVLIQIEALLNSRPLCWSGSDPTDPLPLTPSHFLHLTPLKSLPATPISDLKLADRKTILDGLVQSFWNRWRAEYISSLQQRQKWDSKVFPIMEGMLVLVHSDNLPPLCWPLGRVIEVMPGKDGVIRVAKVKTTTSELVRPVVKLCPLPQQ